MKFFLTAYKGGMDDVWYGVAVVAAMAGLASVMLGFLGAFSSDPAQTPLIVGITGGFLSWAVVAAVLLTRWMAEGVALFETEHVELATTVWTVSAWCLLVMVSSGAVGVGLMMWAERFDGHAARWREAAGVVAMTVSWVAGLVLLGAFVTEWVVSGSLF